MNQEEYEALSDETLPHEAKVLYVLCLRRHMDFDSGIVGVRRKVSYQQFREHLSYHPGRGSRDGSYVPSKDQIKRLIQKLVNRGLITPMHQTGRPGEKMIFWCNLATQGSIRPDEERHLSATGAPPQGAPQENPATTGAGGDVSATGSAIRAPQDERHTSVTSVFTSTSSSNAREEFAMHQGWKPSQSLGARLQLAGIDLNSIPKEERQRIYGEFTSYWMGQEGRKCRQSEWDHKLVQQIINRDRAGGQHVNQQTAGNTARPSTERQGVARAIGDIEDQF